MPKHCPVCGKSSADIKFFGEFCEECSARALLKSINPELEITECRRCGRIGLGDKFVEKDRKSIEDILERNFKNHAVKLLSLNGSTARVALAERNGPYAETDVKINSRLTTCPACIRRSSGYYEGVIQFRGKPERIEKITEKLSSYLERRDSFIAKMVGTDKGKDVYVSSKSLAAAFLKRMHLEYKISYTLHGVKNGRKLYRHTFSVSL